MNIVDSRDRQGLTTLFLKLLSVSAFLGVGVSFYKFYLFHIILSIACLWFFYQFLTDVQLRKSFKFRPETSFFIFYVAWYFLSILWSGNQYLGLQSSIQITIGSLLIFLMGHFIRDDAHLKQILKPLAIVYLMHIGLCFLEIFTPFRWFISPASELSYLFGRPMDPGFHEMGHYELSQPTSFFWGPNDTAFVTILGLPFFMYLAPLYLRVILIVSSLVITTYASSRGLLIILFSFFIAYLVERVLHSRKIGIKYLVTGLVLFLLSIGLFLGFADGLKKKEVFGSFDVFAAYTKEIAPIVKQYALNERIIFNNSNENIKERVAFLTCAMDMSYGSRLLGVGAGDILTKSCDYGREYKLASIHNYWIEVLVEGGFFLTLFYMGWILLVLVKLFKRRKNKMALASFFSLGLFIVGVPSISRAIYFLPKYLLYALIVAFLATSLEKDKKIS
jgi:teichuronic acid biosynthesis protein TuaE